MVKYKLLQNTHLIGLEKQINELSNNYRILGSVKRTNYGYFCTMEFIGEIQ